MLGVVMMVAGAVVTIIGVALFLSDADAPPTTTVPAAAATTTVPVTDDSVATVEDLLASSPTVTTSTTVPEEAVTADDPVDTTTTAPPPSTLALEETLEEFVAAFAAATEADDFDFVWSRMHPAVIERADGDEALCRAWVEREILALDDYALLDLIEGPAPFGDLDNVFTVAVTFSFQGEDFDGIGQYVADDGRLLWLGQCR